MNELLKVVDLKKYFHSPAGQLHAVDGVNFTLGKGKTLGVVGESGCGKSTLGRTLLGLQTATSGMVFYKGTNITEVTGKDRKEFQKEMQIIFQDPFSSLNPRLCVLELIGDPLRTFKLCKKQKGTRRTRL